jgi:2-oxoisovalerate ferredoxin oxidoreductase beta subunit
VGETKDWKRQPKKSMMDIMVAHKIPYAATVSVGFPEDMIKKLRKAQSIRGPKFIQIYAPCPTGWRMPPEKTIEICRVAVATAAYPLYEVENGVYTITRKPDQLKPVKEYMAMQGRFRHLPEEEVESIQKTVNWEWKRLLALEQFTKGLVEQ